MNFTDIKKRPVAEKLFEESKKYFLRGFKNQNIAEKSQEYLPVLAKRGDKASIWDVDEQNYLDFYCDAGAMILGHNNEKVLNAVKEKLTQGIISDLSHSAEIDLARLLIENHRFIEKIQFVNSVTEAFLWTVQLAQQYTSKQKIVKFKGCYHGEELWLNHSTTDKATFGDFDSIGKKLSLSDDIIELQLNDLAAFEALLKIRSQEIAAVIIEPIPTHGALLIQDNAFLAWLRKWCDDYDVLLIFDEMTSGFRVNFEGASGYYAIAPDLVLLGKILGGGMPLYAFGGREDIMDTVFSGKYDDNQNKQNAHPLSLVAGHTSIEQLLEEGFYEALACQTNQFVHTLNLHIETKKLPFHIQHIASIFWIALGNFRIVTWEDIDPGSLEFYAHFNHEMLKRGIYFGPEGIPLGYISSVHTEAQLNNAALQICEALDDIFSK